MNSRPIPALFAFAILAFAALPAAAEADDPADKKPSLNTFARPIERSPPRFPATPLRRGQEGWVIVSYVVQTDGTVADPIVIDSSGVEDFEKAALDTVLAWTFQPATQDGKPVQQCETETQLTFAIETRERGARKKFASRYKKIRKLLENGEVDQAEALLDEAMELGEWNLYEYSRLWLLDASVAHARGDARAQLRALNRAIGKKGDFVENKVVSAVLPLMLQLELTLSDYSAAISTYDEMKKRSKIPDEYQALVDAVNKILAAIESEQVLRSPAKLSSCNDCEGRWTYKPLRRTFEFANIVGSLDKLELRCDWRLYRNAITEGRSWKIPESWGDCQLNVYGKSETTFDFLEFPEATETPPVVSSSAN